MTPIHIINESVPKAELRFGHGTVGTAEQRLPSYPILKYVAIQAAAGNTNTVTVGRPGSAITGWILAAGESTPPFPVDDLAKLAVVGGAAGQNYNWFGL